MTHATGWGLRDAVVGNHVRVWTSSYEAAAIRKVIRANKTKVTLADESGDETEWTRAGRRWGDGRDVWHGKSADVILDLAAVQREIAEWHAVRRLGNLRRVARERVDQEVRHLCEGDCKAIIAILDTAKAEGIAAESARESTERGEANTSHHPTEGEGK